MHAQKLNCETFEESFALRDHKFGVSHCTPALANVVCGKAHYALSGERDSLEKIISRNKIVKRHDTRKKGQVPPLDQHSDSHEIASEPAESIADRRSQIERPPGKSMHYTKLPNNCKRQKMRPHFYRHIQTLAKGNSAQSWRPSRKYIS